MQNARCNHLSLCVWEGVRGQTATQEPPMTPSFVAEVFTEPKCAVAMGFIEFIPQCWEFMGIVVFSTLQTTKATQYGPLLCYICSWQDAVQK